MVLTSSKGWISAEALTTTMDVSEQEREIGQAVSAVALGVVVASLTCCFRRGMLFVFGAGFGVQLGSIANIMVLPLFVVSNPNRIGYGVMAGCALVFGVVSSCATR